MSRILRNLPPKETKIACKGFEKKEQLNLRTFHPENRGTSKNNQLQKHFTGSY